MPSFGLRTLLTLPVLFAPLPTLAQVTREEIQREPVAPTPPPTGGRVSVEGDIERAPCPLADTAYKDIRVTLSGVEFSGLGPIPPELLRPSYAGSIGQTLPIAAVCDIRDRAATILRREGYLAAVQVPAQRIENGVVHFDVLIAKLVGIQVRGEAGNAEGIIQRYMKRIQDQPVFNILSAERYLLLARDLPGYDVRLTLRPAGTVPGEVIGEVQVVHVPVEADLNLQNYGSREVGRFGGLAQLRFNSLMGAGDRTTLGFFSTADFKEQQVAQASEEIRIGSEGLTLGADFTYAWTRPSLGAGINLRSHTFVASLDARYPLVRRQSRNLYVSGGFDLIDQSSRFNGARLTEDRLRVLYARADFDTIDRGSISGVGGYSAAEPLWRLGGSFEVRQGLAGLGASNGCRRVGPVICSTPPNVPPSRIEGDPSAFVVRGQAYAEFRPLPLLGFSIQPRFQYAPHALLSYEEFSAGNYTIGRGFDPGTLIGDSGFGVRGEATYGSQIPQSRDGLALQGYAFVDAAWVSNKDSSSNGFDPQKLQSAGGGVRAVWGDRFRLDAGVAVPWHDVFSTAGTRVERGGNARALVTLTVKLLPWRR